MHFCSYTMDAFQGKTDLPLKYRIGKKWELDRSIKNERETKLYFDGVKTFTN